MKVAEETESESSAILILKKTKRRSASFILTVDRQEGGVYGIGVRLRIFIIWD